MNEQQIEELTSAIRSISHGGVHGATGLEALAMAIAGDGLGTPLAESVDRVANALEGIAEAIREVGSRD